MSAQAGLARRAVEDLDLLLPDADLRLLGPVAAVDAARVQNVVLVRAVVLSFEEHDGLEERFRSLFRVADLFRPSGGRVFDAIRSGTEHGSPPSRTGKVPAGLTLLLPPTGKQATAAVGCFPKKELYYPRKAG